MFRKAHFQIRKVGWGWGGGTECHFLKNQLKSKGKIMDKERQLGKKSLLWYLHALTYSNKSQIHQEMFSFFKEDF